MPTENNKYFQLTPLQAATISAWAEYETGFKSGASKIKVGYKPQFTPENHEHLTGLCNQTLDLNDILQGFEVTHVTDDDLTGYFGAILVNCKTKHIVLVHRPTNFALSLTDNLFGQSGLQHDIEGILKNNVTQHECVASTVSQKMIQMYQSKEYLEYSFNAVGHSLAAWLATITALDFYQKGIYIRAVTFDGPGAKDAYLRYDPSLDLKALSVTNFISRWPNLVNTAGGGHVGETYALSTHIPLIRQKTKPSFCCHGVESKQDMMHATAHGHDFRSMFPCFDNSGFPEEIRTVVRWPMIHFVPGSAAEDAPDSTTLGSIINLFINFDQVRIDKLAEFYKKLDSGVEKDGMNDFDKYRIDRAANYNVCKIDDKKIIAENSLLQLLCCLKDRCKDFEDTPEILELLSKYSVESFFDGRIIVAQGNYNIRDIVDEAHRVAEKYKLLASVRSVFPADQEYFVSKEWCVVDYSALKFAAKQASDSINPYRQSGVCSKSFDTDHAKKQALKPMTDFVQKHFAGKVAPESVATAVKKAIHQYQHKEGTFFKQFFKDIFATTLQLVQNPEQTSYQARDEISTEPFVVPIAGDQVERVDGEE